MDTAKLEQGERAEASIDQFIAKRDAARRKAEGERLEEERWQASSREYAARRQEEVRAEWIEYRRRMRDLHWSIGDGHAEELKKLERDTTVSLGHHEEIAQSLGEAQELDARERAGALRAGKKDPGKPREEKARMRLSEIEDEMSLLEVVIADVERDLSGAITNAKPALIREARQKREEASRDYTQAHTRLRESHDTFKFYDGLVRWAHTPGPHFAPQPPDVAVLSVPAVLEDNDPEKPAPEVVSSEAESAPGLLRGA